MILPFGPLYTVMEEEEANRRFDEYQMKKKKEKEGVNLDHVANNASENQISETSKSPVKKLKNSKKKNAKSKKDD